jgi:hypothetical protein
LQAAAFSDFNFEYQIITCLDFKLWKFTVRQLVSKKYLSIEQLLHQSTHPDYEDDVERGKRQHHPIH